MKASCQRFETEERKKEKKRKENCFRLRKQSDRNLKQKKRKRKRTLNSDIILVFRLKLFCNVELFFVSVQFRVSSSDFSILSFISFCFIYLCHIKYCAFCSTMRSEICAMSAEMCLLNLFPLGQILCCGMNICWFWNIVIFFFCISIVELLLPFLVSILFLTTFLSLSVPTKLLSLLLSWSATFEALSAPLSLYLYLRLTRSG